MSIFGIGIGTIMLIILIIYLIRQQVRMQTTALMLSAKLRDRNMR